MKKRFLSILLTALLLCAVPLVLVDTAYAAEAANSGTCGDNVTWRLSDDGVLTISGTGVMADYNYYDNRAPWNSVRSQVKSVVIERGVTSIGDSAFYDCSLTSVTIPDSVTSIGWVAFSGYYSSLTNVYYDGYGIDWLAVDGHDEIPDSTTVHFKDDLYGKGMCGDNVNWIMTLDGTLTISGKGCVSDYTAVYDKNTSEFVTDAPWQAAKWYIKAVVIENGVTGIGEHAFYACRVLERVTIPDTVTSIGDYAFCFCQELTGVTIPNSVTSLGSYIFNGCDNLAAVTISANVTNIRDCAFRYCYALTTLTIPEGVTTIEWEAFSGCSSLTSVTIPASVTSIGNSAFYGCDALTDVYYGGYGLDWLAMGSHGDISKSTTVHFKEDMYGKGMCGLNVNWAMTADGTLTISGKGRISNYAYYDHNSAPWSVCQSYVKSVVIKRGVTSIGSDVFYNCYNLTSVTIPNTVTAIGNNAFHGCQSLSSMVIPNSVTSIGDSAFSGCASLGNVTIPSSVTTIGSSAFSNCTGLTDVTIPVGVTIIDWAAFSNCTSLKSVTIPNTVTSIDNKVFAGCTSLTSVTIPNSVTRIWHSAFSGCKALTSVTIPESVTNIEGSAFEGCAALAEIRLPSALKNIAYNTLSNCVRLTSVTIPKSVTDIEEKAFYYCDSLTDIYYTGTAEDWAKITIGDGNGDLTNATLHCAKSAPAAPVVKIGNSAASGKPMLTWNAVGGATSYRIYRSTAKGSGYSLLGTVTATSYTNTGAKAGTTYYYRVKACNDAGLSPYSNIVSGQTKAVAQQKPSAPVVKIGNSASSGKPMLTWNAVSGATSYKVYRATSQNGTYSLLGTVTTTSYTNTGAKAGTAYYYKVKAVNSAGESAYSNIVSGRATVTTLTMGHSATSGKPQLTWKAVSGAASYKVYRATSKNGAYSVINTTKALTYTNTGAVLGTTYYYKVEALNSTGKSMGFSAIVEGKVAPVLAVGYSSVSGKPQLTWKAVPGATEYQVYRSTQQNSGYTKINTTTATSYVNTGAKANTTYYYKIVAVKGTAASDFSNIVSARPGR